MRRIASECSHIRKLTANEFAQPIECGERLIENESALTTERGLRPILNDMHSLNNVSLLSSAELPSYLLSASGGRSGKKVENGINAAKATGDLLWHVMETREHIRWETFIFALRKRTAPNNRYI